MSAFVMPSLGADMKSAVLMEWKVKAGDHVEKGEVIAEVETNKGVIEIEVFETGVVEKILVEPETECKVGTPLAMIRAEGEELSAPEEASPPEAALEPERAEEEAVFEEPAPTPAPEAAGEVSKAPEERVKATPAARRRAAELGVELASVTPGAEGIVHLEEVDAAAEKGAEKAPKKETAEKEAAPEAARKKETPQKKAAQDEAMRQAIAAAMSRSNANIPHYYLSTPINMTPALEWLEAHNAKRSIEKRILPAALMIRAVVKGLQEVPELNGFWEEGGHRISEEIHPGIAIALRTGGLITPALLNAQAMDLEETMAALADLITRTRSGRLRGAEMTRQTVTLTNLGDLGVERVYGVIYPPQVALVGLGRIADAPWAEGDALSVRKVLHATLAGDHRATDGRTGARFLERLNRILQDPEELR